MIEKEKIEVKIECLKMAQQYSQSNEDLIENALKIFEFVIK